MRLLATRLTAIASAVKRLFNPLSLFASGEQGVWYDPSDFSTMFQDSAGTTPVTAVEQPVGLILDKSKGLVLGPELVTNGGFDTTSGWTLTASATASAVISGGSLSLVSDGTTCNATRADFIPVLGKTYTYTIVVTAASGGGSYLYMGNGSPAFTSPGTYTGKLLCTSVAWSISRVGGGASSAAIDNISVRELPGDHGKQATAASRPVLSARVNLLTYSEDFSNAIWSKTDVTLAKSQTSSAGAANDAWLVTEGSAGTASVTQDSSVVAAGSAAAVRIVMKRGNTDWVRVGLYGGGFANYSVAWFNLATGVKGSVSNVGTSVGGTSQMTSLGGGFYELTVACTPNSTYTTPKLGFLSANADLSTTRVSGATYTVERPQLETGSTATRYQSITTATSYDTVGFPYYLKFDGVDDSLATAAINFTSTDKMTVFAGVRKLSDAAVGLVVELSSDLNTNNGSFYVGAPANNGVANTGFSVKGTIASGASASSFASPISAVVTGTAAISSPLIIQRRNGVQVSSSSAALGTGNFGNYNLYVGSRGGTTLPFNGHLYSLIIRGAASSASQIASAESYVNSKTGAY